jgi:PAS domain S-box-containing protein
VVYVMEKDMNLNDLLTIINGIGDPILVISKDRSIRYMNQAAKAASLSIDTTPSKTRSICHELLRCRTTGEESPVSTVFNTGRPAKKIYRGINRENGQTLIEVSAAPLFSDTGEVKEVVKIVRDISDYKDAKDASQEHDDGYRAMFDNMLDGCEYCQMIFEQGHPQDFIFIAVNTAFEKLLGLKNVVGKKVSEVVPGLRESHPDLFEIYGRVALTGKPERFEHFVAPLMTWVSVSVYSAEKGYFFAIFNNITERKRAEEQLLESQRELKKKHEELTQTFKLVEAGKKEWEKTMDCVSDLIMLTDSNGRIRRCNRPLTAFTGKPYEALLGKDWKQVLAEDGLQAEQFNGMMMELFHQPTNRWFTIRRYHVSGIEGDNSSGEVISLHDFTDRKHITQELERTNQKINESRKNFQTALERISSLIQQAAQEKALSVRFENPNLEKCHVKMGCVRKECSCHGKEAMRCWQVSGTFSGGDHECAYTKIYGSCHNCPVFECATPDPVFQIGEQFNSMMHILELKNYELEHAYTELKLTQSKILQQEKMASIGQLAAGVAHEINNPMGFISSNLGSLNKYIDRIIEYTQTLSETLNTLNDPRIAETMREARSNQKFDFIVEDIKKLIAESADGADRVKTIVQNLKSFSRVDQKEDVFADINDCMETTLNIAWNELKYNATVRKEYATLPLIKCNPQQLNQVFMNLLVNAAHAIEKQGEIVIKTWEQDGSVFISVSDTGCGIPEVNLGKIFEPFFTTKEVGKGTGLGLSIAYDIVKKHNGEITVRSEVNKGTTFFVRIPAKTPSDEVQ